MIFLYLTSLVFGSVLYALVGGVVASSRGFLFIVLLLYISYLTLLSIMDTQAESWHRLGPGLCPRSCYNMTAKAHMIKNYYSSFTLMIVA